MQVRVKRLREKGYKRTICISDIHGNLPLFKALLAKIDFCGEDLLLILGDIFLKGPYPGETLRYAMQLSRQDNVHCLLGNCDFADDGLSREEKEWLAALPHVLELDDYVCVHAGLAGENLTEQELEFCVKNDAFMENGGYFSKYVVTGHWPTDNYCHTIPCANPIVNEEKKIIAIDGGNVVRHGGQLNAFIIQNSGHSFEAVCDYPMMASPVSQKSCGESVNVTWTDRALQPIDVHGEFTLCRHLKTDTLIHVPGSYVFRDAEGNICAKVATTHLLEVAKGEEVYVVEAFSNRILAKKHGVMGWIMLPSGKIMPDEQRKAGT